MRGSTSTMLIQKVMCYPLHMNYFTVIAKPTRLKILNILKWLSLLSKSCIITKHWWHHRILMTSLPNTDDIITHCWWHHRSLLMT